MEPRVQDRKAAGNFLSVGLIAFVLMAAGNYQPELRDLQLSATTGAVVAPTDGPYDGAYRYRYLVGDRVCEGQAGPPAVKPQTNGPVQVHYDPNNVCDSVTYDPLIDLSGQMFILAGMSAVSAFFFWLSLRLERRGSARPEGTCPT